MQLLKMRQICKYSIRKIQNYRTRVIKIDELKTIEKKNEISIILSSNCVIRFFVILFICAILTKIAILLWFINSINKHFINTIKIQFTNDSKFRLIKHRDTWKKKRKKNKIAIKCDRENTLINHWSNEYEQHKQSKIYFHIQYDEKKSFVENSMKWILHTLNLRFVLIIHCNRTNLIWKKIMIIKKFSIITMKFEHCTCKISKREYRIKTKKNIFCLKNILISIHNNLNEIFEHFVFAFKNWN